MFQRTTLFIRLFAVLALIANSTLVISQPARVDGQVYTANGRPHPVDNVDFLVTNVDTHLQSKLSVYSHHREYRNIYADSGNFPSQYCYQENSKLNLPHQVAVQKNKQLLWEGSGIFSDIEFSANGNALLFTRQFDHQHQHTIIANGRVQHFYQDVRSHHKNMTRHTNNFSKEHLCIDASPTKFKKIANDASQILRYERQHRSSINNVQLCHITDDTLFNSCEDITTSTKTSSPLINAAIGDNNEVYLVYTNKLIRLFGSAPQWKVSLNDFDDNYTARLILYKSLILVADDDVVNLYDRDNGNLLYTRSRLEKRDFFESFYYVHIREDKLVFQLKGTSDFGRVDISEYLR